MAADCTGHGVPGAFMSMLGATLLNEIVHAFLSEQSGELSASAILAALSGGVVESLHQKGNIGEQKDGMDISLCIIDLDLISEGFTQPYYNLQFAGANNPVYIVRPKAEHKSLFDVTEIKGNRRPIGIHSGDNKEFTDHNLKIFTGDSLYMFTDGFADQFGGISGRKFRYNQFRDLIDVIQEFDMHKQKQMLEIMFDEWKGNLSQTDDILVIGIKF
jgi:serine phosphatase RsbU (regulator of sigma subunit)